MAYKLTEEQILELTTLKKEGYKLTELLSIFPVSLSTIKRHLYPNMRKNLNKTNRERYSIDPVMRKNQSKTMKKWLKNNKLKHNSTCLSNYHRNKSLWQSRAKTNYIINSKKYGYLFLDRKCKNCKKTNELEIHHEKYPTETKDILSAFENNMIYFVCQPCHGKIDAHKKLKIEVIKE